jgi:hypothetical protein
MREQNLSSLAAARRRITDQSRGTIKFAARAPTRLLRLSKNLPHDWKEQRRFLRFAA